VVSGDRELIAEGLMVRVAERLRTATSAAERGHQREGKHRHAHCCNRNKGSHATVAVDARRREHVCSLDRRSAGLATAPDACVDRVRKRFLG
jgi:hypothetical protein